MAGDHLADNLDWNTGTRGISGGIPSQIVRQEMGADQVAGFTNHNPCGVVTDWEKPLFRPDARIFHVAWLTFIGHLLVCWVEGEGALFKLDFRIT